MKQRIIFLIISFTIIFSAILLSNLIIFDDVLLLPVNLNLPENILDESYVTLGTAGSNNIWAANLPDGTEVYHFTRLPFNAFVIRNGKVILYAEPFAGHNALKEYPIFPLMQMAEREEYTDISHYLVAMHRTFSRLENDRFYGFHFEVPDEIKPKLRKAISELSEIYGFEYKEGELHDFITAHEGFSWEFKEEYDKMMWIYISSADRVFSGNMEITVGKVTGSLGSIDITYLVEKIDGKWTVTRELSVGQS